MSIVDAACLMAESQVVAKQALKKLEDQLTCAICLDSFKDPKLLQCFHVYCKDCLQRLVVQDQQGQLSLRCPICRQSTPLPPGTDASALQPAFHVHHLFEIQEAIEKLKEPQKVKCEKCTKSSRTATSFCRDCGKFICERCLEMHSEWEDFSKHEVMSMGQMESNVKQLVPPKKVTLYCSQHQGKELDLYCETCEELICLHCTVKKHKDHQYDLVGDTFERHKAEMTASLEPVESQLGMTTDAIGMLDVRSRELDDQGAAVVGNIKRQVQQFIETLLARQDELIGQVEQHIQMKKKNLAAQKDELETVHTQLASCLCFVTNSLQTGSEGEVLKMKRPVMKQIKEMTDNFKPDMLPPCESANVKFFSSPTNQANQLQKFGNVYLQQISPEKWYATGKGLETAKAGERATATLHIVDDKGEACTMPVETVTCELVSETTGEKMDCFVKKAEANQYDISYQPTTRGRHQLHIKVESRHIKGSPFSVSVTLPVNKLGTPIKTIGGVKQPWGVAIDQRGNIIVAENEGHCVSIFSASGEKVKSFGSHGSSSGQFNWPEGVAVDGDGNILVADYSNHRIQKFTSQGTFVMAVGKRGDKQLDFSGPIGISIHPCSRKVYVVDSNHRIQVLNSDLTFSNSFGCYGTGSGQFSYPHDVAFDSTGNVYVADYNNGRIQVFTTDGQYLRQFGRMGKGNGELNSPRSISIDADNVVYVTESGNQRVSVFTCEGKFLTSFGRQGSEPGQFTGPFGIAVDKNGVVYVTDYGNNRMQLF